MSSHELVGRFSIEELIERELITVHKDDQSNNFDHLFPDSFEESALGFIPKGWSTKSLYDTANYVNGAAFKNSDFSDAGVGRPVIKIAELKHGVSKQTKWTERILKKELVIEKGALLYSWSGSPETSLEAFLWTGKEGVLNQHVFNVVTHCQSQKRFVYYLLKHLRSTLVDIARNKQTTGLGHVTVADMKLLHSSDPPEHVLARFDQLIGPAFDFALSLTIETNDLAEVRDRLLPQLLSGDLSLQSSSEMAI